MIRDHFLSSISSFHFKLPKKHIDQLNVAVHVQSNEFASANDIKEMRYFKNKTVVFFPHNKA
ncbi:hypothetical protein T4D_2802 [Trichinella pseudospiralis]|uniref:Uncharacterized protein n=1 Tax=Trichinella pseudospiralis TaxID=6337 RepID=A0A0V1G2G8_TRIPS|nr:hypothetical protein T4D_2802 [Trichinella pseudospiralis]